MLEGLKLKNAKKKADTKYGARIDHDMTDWITVDLLRENETFPFGLEPTGFRTFVMNLRTKDGVNLWGVGKAVQRMHRGKVEFEAVAEVQAGYWEYLRQRVL